MIDFIINSDKYPKFIKENEVFRSLNQIKKIFPWLGLSNFTEEISIQRKEDITAAASGLIGEISSEIYKSTNALRVALSRNKDEKYLTLIEILTSMYNYFNDKRYYTNNLLKNDAGKYSLKLDKNFSRGIDVLFRFNESIFKVYNKLGELLKTEQDITLTKLDNLHYFKTFSNINLPNKKYKLIFSSTGQDGIWDLSTISMRGIASCQSWDKPQSRALVGSIASKYVGVIYIALNEEIPGFGKKMLHRALVRFCVDSITNKPCLVMDNIYPSAPADIKDIFLQSLKSKVKIPVKWYSDPNVRILTYLPDEPINKIIKTGEFTYSDYQLICGKKQLPTELTKSITNLRYKMAEEIFTSLSFKHIRSLSNSDPILKAVWVELDQYRYVITDLMRSAILSSITDDKLRDIENSYNADDKLYKRYLYLHLLTNFKDFNNYVNNSLPNFYLGNIDEKAKDVIIKQCISHIRTFSLEKVKESFNK